METKNFLKEKMLELKKIEREIEETKSILKSGDLEWQKLVEKEIAKLEMEKAKIKNELEKFMKNEKMEKAIVEIRAGVGGEEAALFAKDLFQMYSNFVKKMGWKITIFEKHVSDLGGFKEVVFEIVGKGVWSKMKFEGGIHRVQRIPKTERKGRIHTSTTSVAVLQEPKEIDFKIKNEDLKIEFTKASGHGGQYVNKRETAVKITHLPTGIFVKCQSERSQLKNKEIALKILRAKIFQKEKEKIEREIKEKREKQIKMAQRAEKIRTYNFPENRITDHRLGKTWRNLKEVLEGNLDKIIGELEKLERSQNLSF